MSTNPFGDPDDEASGEILEGFLCPICREDLKSLEFLTKHFERAHAEDQDALKSIFTDIFTKAKNKIRQNFDDSFDLSRSLEKNASLSGTGSDASAASSSSNAHTPINVYNFMGRQGSGVERPLFDTFQAIRNPRLERYASETNKLIIRLHKLLKDRPADPVLRKQHEQNTVTWLDGSSVKLCPSCARSFHLARRQHHCRLCGSIMCNDCSRFLPIENALELASLTMPHSDSIKPIQTSINQTSQQSGIRSCHHCLWLLDTRQEMHESRTCHPPITQIYSEIQNLKKDVLPDIDMYQKIIGSLYEGESIFTIADASALRGKIGQVAEAIDVRSKRIMSLATEEGSRAEALKKAVRLSCIQLIKEKMLSLPPLPNEEAIRKIQDRKRMEAEQRIATERRQAMEAYERYGLGDSSTNYIGDASYVQGSDMRSLDNWTAHQVSVANVAQNDDPLIEQINIIKGYIKQARQEMNYEVVETLEINLRELQREFYVRQRGSINPDASSPEKNHF